MMNDSIRWNAISRKALPGVLIGMEPTPSEIWASASDAAHQSDLALGIVRTLRTSENRSSYLDGTILVIEESKAADLFSWINTYSEDSFPLSQFSRVLSIKDWENLELSSKNRPYESNQGVKWGCITLGETLGQGAAVSDISRIPFSRAHACLTSTIARAALLYGSDSPQIDISIDRLTIMQNEKRFARRKMDVESLSIIWQLLSSAPSNQSPADAVNYVLSALESHSQHDLLTASSYDMLKSLPGLWSDSAEERVRAFEQAVIWSLNRSNQNELVPPIISAAAFIVGRGTSHIRLLSKFSSQYPTCFAWFSLYAALSGPKHWDGTWARAARGFEKQIKQNFSLADNSAVDLSWIEYFWLSRSFDGAAIFSHLPKVNQKLLTVELVPGAACQFPLEGEAQPSNKKETTLAPPPSKTRSIAQVLAEIEALITEVKQFTDGRLAGNITTSSSADSDSKTQKKSTQSKRSKRAPNST